MSKAKNLLDQQTPYVFREYVIDGIKYRQITSLVAPLLDNFTVPSGERWIIAGEMHAKQVSIEAGAVLILPESRAKMDDIIEVINAVESYTVIKNTSGALEDAWMIDGPKELLNLNVALAGEFSSEVV